MERIEPALMISYCGLKCDECDAYIATRINSREEAEKLARKWSTEDRSFATEDIWCDGCTGEDGRIFIWCKECPIRSCCAERQLLNCAHCGDFPCEIIESAPGETKERLVILRKSL